MHSAGAGRTKWYLFTRIKDTHRVDKNQETPANEITLITGPAGR